MQEKSPPGQRGADGEQPFLSSRTEGRALEASPAESVQEDEQASDRNSQPGNADADREVVWEREAEATPNSKEQNQGVAGKLTSSAAPFISVTVVISC